MSYAHALNPSHHAQPKHAATSQRQDLQATVNTGEQLPPRQFSRQVTDFEVTAMYPVHAPAQEFNPNDTVAESRPDVLDDYEFDDSMTVVDEAQTIFDYNPFADEASPSLVADAEAVFAALRERNRPAPQNLQDLAYDLASIPNSPHPQVAVALIPKRSWLDRVSDGLKQFACSSRELVLTTSHRLLRFGRGLLEKRATRQG